MNLSFASLPMRAAAFTLVACAGLAAAGGAGTSSESLLRQSFSAALGADPSADRVARPLPVAGTEEFWLNAMRADAGAQPTPGLNRAVSIGDRIAMTLDGKSRQLKVEQVAAIAPSITEIDTATVPSRLVLVTARDTRDSEAKPFRFVVQIPAADVSPARAETAKTL